MENKLILEDLVDLDKIEILTLNVEGIGDIKVREYISLKDKTSIAKMIAENCYGVKKDENSIIEDFSITHQNVVYDVLTIGMIVEAYLLDTELPLLESGGTDYVKTSEISYRSGIATAVMGTDDAWNTVHKIEQEMKTMQLFVENKIKVTMMEKLDESVKIFNQMNLEKLRKDTLENDQLYKTLELMPKDSDGIKSQIEDMSQAIEKLKTSELYDIMDKVGTNGK